MKTGTLLKIFFLLIFLLIGCIKIKQELFPPRVQAVPELSEELTGRSQPPLVIATGDMSGVYFPLGQAMADLFRKYNGKPSGTQVTNASIQNTQLVSQKQAEIGFSTVDVLGLPETKKSEILALTGIYSNFIHIVTTGSDIKTLEDLRGKRVSIGTVGSGTKLMSERILKVANLASYEMDLSTLSFTQSADALRNGAIDVAFFSSGLPNPVIAELASEMEISLVPIPKQIAESLHEEFEFYTLDEISGQTYEGIKSTPTLAVKNVLLTYPDLPKQEAYQIVKTLYDHLPELQNVHPEAMEINLAEATVGIPIDFHPGATQFFKEIIQ
ncbi:TAXI family TRAP transporter solute-binding subunit [Bacillus sp. FJAT-49705]|uniref:TAXI family TRAP transporter solute-binding subunit n=1 Tax=Cytobacillus citreus TaxID=2833586 RepID=A0ABS5NPQ7_9BACI|nr:TAXI family TRAP transporter solute-binding subunit [Cytobacillus citreus]MBS4189795.1 TAXI family TRAP transporter solute-binding subunit [Cytobacillus citreus]